MPWAICWSGLEDGGRRKCARGRVAQKEVEVNATSSLTAPTHPPLTPNAGPPARPRTYVCSRSSLCSTMTRHAASYAPLVLSARLTPSGLPHPHPPDGHIRRLPSHSRSIPLDVTRVSGALTSPPTSFRSCFCRIFPSDDVSFTVPFISRASPLAYPIVSSSFHSQFSHRRISVVFHT
ncbi:uncharacterized protein LAESUDRAFT_724465 [Laetiporus sulphureus 93-53]|uniref:Uncharacterized protein n=1 Tax=Laetiporus sulphureus 93-53 TaxID=1314785 RepID=A0A165EYD5_9APHY|nr:uncharacterized protein LAESUDRAFT_724465 [Laetiporus sulphureus 93-53]KZT07978.1 hypothetical protein LAESUDRAFT_724465 [Laetiporus sulphureus 93-53]